MKCEKQVSCGLIGRTRQCKKNGIVQRDGHWFCLQHDPLKEEEKLNKKEKKWESKQDLKRAIYYSKFLKRRD